MNNQMNNQTSNNQVLSSYSIAQSGFTMPPNSTSTVANNQGTAQATQQGTQTFGSKQAGSRQTGNQNMRSVIGVFGSRSDAETAVSQLRSKGFTNEEISIVSKNKDKGNRGNGDGLVDDDITDGTLTGGTIGGIGGLILGAGALAVPGIGPILAAGPIAAAIGGAMAGGIAGGLIDWGIPEAASERYEESVSRGNILAVIRTDSSKVDQAALVLRQNGANDVESH